MKKKRSSFSILGASLFFVLIALVIQIAILVYDYLIRQTDNKWLIAILILIVILILSALCTVIDLLRRKATVEKPVSEILEATEKIASGNFSVKLTPRHSYDKYNEYDAIMENLNTMASALSKSEILKSDFISNVSHEIKTPLAVIQGYVSLLSKDDLEKSEREAYLKSLNQASKRLNDLISSILKMNKLENQEIKPELAVFSLNEQLAEIILGYEELLEEKSLSLTCSLEETTIKSSKTYLEIVWSNLISNAIKFTPDGGEISVTLTKSGDSATVSVSDTGCGIDSETGALIFEKFYQGDTSHKSQGNGLGLALVKRVIDVFGGEISVSSELGVGSTFTVTLKDSIKEIQ